MRVLWSAAFAALCLPAVAQAQVDPATMPEPPTEELSRLAPFLGSYDVVSDYMGSMWEGDLELRSAVKGWYVEWEINVQSGPIDRQLRMFITWDDELGHYRIWRFETLPPAPPDREQGVGRFEGEDFVMEWNEPTPWGAPGQLRNRLILKGDDILEVVTEGQPLGGEVVRVGVTTARRRR